MSNLTLNEKPECDLDKPVWSVIMHDGVAAIGVTFSTAQSIVSKLNKPVEATVSTYDAAMRILKAAGWAEQGTLYGVCMFCDNPPACIESGVHRPDCPYYINQ